MTRLIKCLLGIVLVPAALLSAAGRAAACPPAPATVIDSIAFGHLPSGLGTASDFSYHFSRVDFVARVWESRTDNGWQVDLDIDVMRGARLSSGRALHDWFIRYEQRDPTPNYHRVRVHGQPGWLCRDQLFWLLRPGLAVSVQLDGTRWPRKEVVRTARSSYEQNYESGPVTDATVRSNSHTARSDTILPSSLTR
ncbi:MAG TPA: hypothetical protein VFE19_04985 [Jatrophihabitantaceae bacterium]|jgi:hypothetical protein|nr:hypothetical protein [Jatrophihabitantaceae bacterium]